MSDQEHITGREQVYQELGRRMNVLMQVTLALPVTQRTREVAAILNSVSHMVEGFNAIAAAESQLFAEVALAYDRDRRRELKIQRLTEALHAVAGDQAADSILTRIAQQEELET